MDTIATPSPRAARAAHWRRFGARPPGQFLASALLLVATVAVVQAVYVLHVLPQAAAIAATQRRALLTDASYIAPRSLYLAIKDYEQEAELILVLWAAQLLALKAVSEQREHRALHAALAAVAADTVIRAQEAREDADRLERLPRELRSCLAPRAFRSALARFAATRNLAEVSGAAHAVCQSEAEQLDAEMSMLRYIAWSIPAIGFIGTVRGIGDALLQARLAGGDVSSVTRGLGLAFNSTLLALLLSIVLMLLLHRLQRAQEHRVLDTETALDRSIIARMQPPGGL